MFINVAKTKIVHFRKKNVPETNINFSLNDMIVEKVSGYRYLGIFLTSQLDISDTVEILAKAGSRALGQLIRKTKSTYDLGFGSFTKLYETTVAPVLDYAVGAWISMGCYNVCKKIDQIQNSAPRFFCGVPRTAPVAGFTGDSGWTPRVVRRDLEVLHMYNQIVKMEECRLTKQIYELDKAKLNQHSWSRNVKEIMISIGEEEAWNRNDVINIKQAKRLLIEAYADAWLDSLNEKVKLNLYKQLKTGWGTESYLKLNMDKRK